MSSSIRINFPLKENDKNINRVALRIENLVKSGPNPGKHLFELGKKFGGSSSKKLSLKLFDLSIKYLEVGSLAMVDAHAFSGTIYHALGIPTKAIESYNTALTILSNRDETREAAIRTRIGISLSEVGKYRLAISHYKKVLKIGMKNDDFKTIASAYYNMSTEYINLNIFDKSEKMIKSALKFYNKIPDPEGEIKCYVNFGFLYTTHDYLTQARIYCRAAIQKGKKSINPDSKMRSYVNMGVLQSKLKNYPVSITTFKKALRIAEKIQEHYVRIKVLMNIATCYSALGSFYEANKRLNKALILAKKMKNKYYISMLYINKGNALLAEKNFKDAISIFRKAFQISSRGSDSFMQSQSSYCIGLAYFVQGKYTKAKTYTEKSLSFNKNFVELELIAYLMLGRLYYRVENDVAYAYLAKYIKLSEVFNKRVIEEQDKIFINEKNFDAYELMILICLELGREDEAFQYIELSKVRVLTEALSTRTDFISLKRSFNPLLKKLLNQEKQYYEKIQRVQLDHFYVAKPLSNDSDLNKLIAKLDVIHNKISELDPEYVHLKTGRPISLKKLQQMLKTIHKSAVVSYFITNKKLIIFVITSSTFHCCQVNVSELKIFQLIEKFEMEISQYWKPFDEEITFELSKLLIQPIAEFLSSVNNVYFVPHSRISRIPLETLFLNNVILSDCLTTSYYPNSTLIQFRTDKSSEIKNISVFGVDFNEEAEDIAYIFDTQSILNATKEDVLMNLNKDALHFSCHGDYIPGDPLSSGILLYNKTDPSIRNLFTVQDILKLRLNNTKLVTLSACKTGLNDPSRGGELIGISTSFMHAGVFLLIVSLWDVNANATRLLMSLFYQNLKNGNDVKNSLRMAQNELKKSTNYNHAYYWSPFILIGG